MLNDNTHPASVRPLGYPKIFYRSILGIRLVIPNIHGT